MDHPDLTVSNFIGNSIGTQQVSNPVTTLTGQHIHSSPSEGEPCDAKPVIKISIKTHVMPNQVTVFTLIPCDTKPSDSVYTNTL